ncbi:MAG: hypothetical protein JO362_24810 [Streptomycetaceae bacterium]|nr:hypothetical protein [Streptomycetaceae bacterium]
MADEKAPLPPEQAALLAELGYNARFVRRRARRKGGQQELADMVARAKRGGLAPRGSEPRPKPAGRYGDAPPQSGKDVILLWLILLPSVLLLLVFFIGCIDLLAMTQGRAAYEDAHMVPAWVAVVMVVGPLAVLDALGRWRGRRFLRGVPRLRPQGVQPGWEDLRSRQLPPGLQELAVLPIITLIPIVYLRHNLAPPGSGLLVIVVLVLVGAFGISLVLAGGPLHTVALVIAWAVWAWLALHGNSTLPTLALLVFTIALGVLYFRRLVKANSEPRPGAAPDAESAP